VLSVSPTLAGDRSTHRCPQLKSIGVGFGASLPGVRSHVGVFTDQPKFSFTMNLLQLLDFKNLQGFFLRLEPAFYINGHFDTNPGGKPFRTTWIS
jgi:hypothetical protein